jgi:hypothetical protein
MSRKIAVVTDALSADLIFPVWLRYYGGLFGRENIFVLTYKGLGAPFRALELGGLIELPVGYNDETRRDVIAGLVKSLLGCYDTVIRVDADEFLVVDPRRRLTLKAFIQGLEAPYMNARGFDVCQMPGEPNLPVDFDYPILRDRGFAYPNTALNKACIIRTPMTWSIGFHWASVYPRFGALFMLHMKRLDIGWQLDWYRRMSQAIRDDPSVPDSLRAYYNPDEDQIHRYHNGVSGRERLRGMETWYRFHIMKTFLDDISLTPATGLYDGKYDHELVLCEIPPEWKSLF